MPNSRAEWRSLLHGNAMQQRAAFEVYAEIHLAWHRQSANGVDLSMARQSWLNACATYATNEATFMLWSHGELVAKRRKSSSNGV